MIYLTGDLRVSTHKYTTYIYMYNTNSIHVYVYHDVQTGVMCGGMCVSNMCVCVCVSIYYNCCMTHAIDFATVVSVVS